MVILYDKNIFVVNNKRKKVVKLIKRKEEWMWCERDESGFVVDFIIKKKDLNLDIYYLYNISIILIVLVILIG